MSRYVINDKDNNFLYVGDRVKHIPYGNPLYTVEGSLHFFEGLWLGLRLEDGRRYIFEPFEISSDEFELIEAYEVED